MNINELKNESIDSLKSRLLSLYKEKFKLRLKKTNEADFKKTHLIKINRKNIARVLTFISKNK